MCSCHSIVDVVYIVGVVSAVGVVSVVAVVSVVGVVRVVPVVYVTLHGTLMLKVKARARHAFTLKEKNLF